tara:strand:- start:1721 stop:1876 length:156 start_codon:yes stop_codon:yes gene_type:complete
VQEYEDVKQNALHDHLSLFDRLEIIFGEMNRDSMVRGVNARYLFTIDTAEV